MLKRVYGKKLSRAQGARRALFRSLIMALVRDGKIVTTKAKAKAVQADLDKIMKKVRKADLSSQREVLAALGNDKETVSKLFGELKGLASQRQSGFTRITALPPRRGDAAEIVRLEWSGKIEEKKKSEKKEKPKEKK